MVLAGQRPEVIMEICSRAMSFWTYQVNPLETYKRRGLIPLPIINRPRLIKKEHIKNMWQQRHLRSLRSRKDIMNSC